MSAAYAIARLKRPAAPLPFTLPLTSRQEACSAGAFAVCRDLSDPKIRSDMRGFPYRLRFEQERTKTTCYNSGYEHRTTAAM